MAIFWFLCFLKLNLFFFFFSSEEAVGSLTVSKQALNANQLSKTSCCNDNSPWARLRMLHSPSTTRLHCKELEGAATRWECVLPHRTDVRSAADSVQAASDPIQQWEWRRRLSMLNKCNAAPAAGCV